MINKMFLRSFGLYVNLIKSLLCQVIIMGATNRPEDIDPAILRRMPTKIHIKLPVCPFQNKSDCFLKTNQQTKSILNAAVYPLHWSVCVPWQHHHTFISIYPVKAGCCGILLNGRCHYSDNNTTLEGIKQ